MMQVNHCYQGDCRDVMRQLIAAGVQVQTIVTSPPYYGLRDYAVAGQLGLEETPQQYIDAMVEVFTVLWFLLADDGTFWLNIGDSYSSHKDCKSTPQSLALGTAKEQAHVMSKGISRVRDSKMLKSQGLKNKDLIGIPWMLAFALRDAGWYLRQDIIWHKPNPMPESVTDRCTKSHEYLFLLTKSAKYYYDNDAIKETSVTKENRPNGIERNRIYDYNSKENTMRGKRDSFKREGRTPSHRENRNENEYDTNERNKRSVWSINTKPFSEAHFAVMPEALVEPCILAGSKVGDIVFDPFMGSGTVGKVAQNLGRKWLGAELNPDYLKIQNKRTAQQSFVLSISEQELNKAVA
ncbi:MAG: site-specific DNA-methyltransferase [Pseudomonadota bacterium]